MSRLIFIIYSFFSFFQVTFCSPLENLNTFFPTLQKSPNYEQLIKLENNKFFPSKYSILATEDIFIYFYHVPHKKKYQHIYRAFEDFFHENDIESAAEKNKPLGYFHYRMSPIKFHISVHPEDLALAWDIFYKIVYSSKGPPPFNFKVTNLNLCKKKIEIINKQLKKLSHLQYLGRNSTNTKLFEKILLEKAKMNDILESNKRLCLGLQITIYPMISFENSINSKGLIDSNLIQPQIAGATIPNKELAIIKDILFKIAWYFKKFDIRPGEISETDVVLMPPYISGRKGFTNRGYYIDSALIFSNQKSKYVELTENQDLHPVIKFMRIQFFESPENIQNQNHQNCVIL